MRDGTFVIGHSAHMQAGMLQAIRAAYLVPQPTSKVVRRRQEEKAAIKVNGFETLLEGWRE